MLRVAALQDCLAARLKELKKGPQGPFVKHMRQIQKTIDEYTRYHRDAVVEHDKQQKMSPQGADEVKRAAGNIEWYRGTLLSAQHDRCWENDQRNRAWVEYNELRAEMDKIHSLGKSVFVPEHMRTYRRAGGY
ncbi:hypothetical protein JCM3775_006552 [Rhodotorula graminis]